MGSPIVTTEVHRLIIIIPPAFRASFHRNLSASLLWKSKLFQQLVKSRVAAERIHGWINLEKKNELIVSLVSPIQESKRLVLIAKLDGEARQIIVPDL